MNTFEDKILTGDRLEQLLQLEDFTAIDSRINPINIIMNNIIGNVAAAGIYGNPKIKRGSPLTTIEETFDQLLFPETSVMCTGVHTLKTPDGKVLRTQMSYLIPGILAEGPFEEHRLIVCPGLIYRREGPYHEMDIWYVRRSTQPFAVEDVIKLINIMVEGSIPAQERKFKGKELYYITDGCRLKVNFQGKDQTFGSGGVIHPQILANAGLDPTEFQGIATNISLKRLAMYIKGIDDYRIFRSTDPRVLRQMSDLKKFEHVSNFPPVQRDLSISVSSKTTLDQIKLKLRLSLEPEILDAIEEVSLISETSYDELPEKARERLGIAPSQKNMLIRITLRSYERTLTKDQANALRQSIFSTINNIDDNTINDLMRLAQEM